MDPATAIGLAAAVVQFVSFTYKLVDRTKEIQQSAKGQSTQVETLGTVYGHLLQLSSRLEASSIRDPKLERDDSSGIAKHIYAINDLSKSCQDDCKRLLEIAKKLQSDGPAGRWQSFRAALRTMWKGDEIDQLEDRLHHTQTTLTLHICALTAHWHGVFERQLREMQRESEVLEARQSAKLDRLADLLQQLNARIASNPSAPGSIGFSPSDMTSLEDQMSRLSIFKRAAAKEQLILKSLSFESRPVRHSSIAASHSRTFEWAFRMSQLQDAEDNGDLLQWLTEGQGSFWVSGKPGSGKSTFMKFIADHPKTLEALTTWSSPNRLVVASHYFWSAGTPMQKSYQGLLQTLLYDIFRQLPDLIEISCEERWPKTTEDLAHEIWLLPELQRVLQRIASQDMEVKFCFFIDGLDEFEGDHIDFCRSLLDLTGSSHIKICVSSRLWNVFEDSFGTDPSKKLYIHDLTHNDIRTYTESRLQEHYRWKDLQAESPAATWLIDQITERAAGVFLWVFLVTGQLRSGLTEYDSLSDLKKRLDSIPVDLEAFFKQILESVEPFYHEKMATTLLITLAAREPAHITIYSFHDEEYEDKDYALKIPVKPLPKNQVTANRERMTRRLNARCRGLVEVTKRGSRVEFLHRSVVDFLNTRGMSEFLKAKAPQGFNPHLSLIYAYTAYIKTTRFTKVVDRTAFAQNTPTPFTSALREVLAHAKEIDETPDAYDFLDEIDHCIPAMQAQGQVVTNVWNHPDNPAVVVFRDFVVEFCLTGYIKHALLQEPGYFSYFYQPLLAFAVSVLLGRIPGGSLSFDDCVKLVQCLLECGCDPNESYLHNCFPPEHQDRSAWKDLISWPPTHHMALTKFPDLSKTRWTSRRGALKHLMALMLKHGADRNIWPREYLRSRVMFWG
ncbi:hypothetical protein QBC47DRAFT_361974 [Echria macrotheca]|uniref:NACHT domain-containing protein n=1 Tax=Echria macrotheca TaxID=438768 RepID=A0AAJ0BBG6_9PEZI|nr:hypothetical protein QBC47DRAFT_361974 [Echria macrotheca]